MTLNKQVSLTPTRNYVAGMEPPAMVTGRPSFGQIVQDAFAQENTVVSAFNAMSDTDTESVAMTGYDAFADIEGTIFEDFPDHLIGVRSPEEKVKAEQGLIEEMERRERLAASGMLGFASMFAAGVLDPLILLPVGGQIKAARATIIAGKAVRGAATVDLAKVALTGSIPADIAGPLTAGISTARAAMLGSTASEIVLNASQDTRTFGESALNVTAAMFLGGVMGGAVGQLSLRSRKIALDGIRRDISLIQGGAGKQLDEVTLTPNDLVDVPGGGPNAAELKLQSALGMERVATVKGAKTIISPFVRILVRSQSLTAKQSVMKLVDSPLRTEGFSTGSSAEAEILSRDGLLFEMLTSGDQAYTAYRTRLAKESEGTELGAGANSAFIQTGGRLRANIIRATDIATQRIKGSTTVMSKNEFMSFAGAASRNRDSGIPELDDLGKMWDERVYQPMLDDAIELGLMPEEVAEMGPVGARRYLQRIYKQDKLIAEEPRFKSEKIRPWLVGVMDDAEIDGILKKAKFKKGDIANTKAEAVADDVAEPGPAPDGAASAKEAEIEARIAELEAEEAPTVVAADEKIDLSAEPTRLDFKKPASELAKLRVALRDAKASTKPRAIEEDVVSTNDTVLDANDLSFNDWADKWEGQFKSGVLTDDGQFIIGRDHGDALNRAEDAGLKIDPEELGQRSGWKVGDEVVLSKDLEADDARGIYDLLRQRTPKPKAAPAAKPKAAPADDGLKPLQQRTFTPEQQVVMDDAIDLRVHQIFENMTGATRGRVPYERIPVSAASAFKPRALTWSDASVAEFLENNIETLGNQYVRTVAPDLAIKRRFGTLTLEREVDQIAKEYAALRQAAKTPAERTKLQKQQAEDKAQLLGMAAILRGTNSVPVNVAAVTGARLARGINTLSMAGGFALNSVPDVGMIPLRNGLIRSFRTGYLPFITHLNATKLARKELQMYGVAVDLAVDTRSKVITDVGDDFAQNRPQEIMQNVSRNFMMVNLLAPWNTMMKGIAGNVSTTRMIEAILDEGAGKVSAREISNLEFARLTPEIRVRIRNQLQASNGMKEQGAIKWANTLEWDDVVAAQEWGRAIRFTVDNTILTPGAGATPLWLSTELGRTLFQFQRFGFGATNTLLLSSLQTRGIGSLVSTFNGLAIMSALGMMVEWAKNGLNDRPNPEDVSGWVTAGIDRTGLMGAYSTVYNVLARATGQDALSSRFAARNLVSSLLGPTLGTAEGVSRLAISGLSGEFSDSDLHVMRRLLPYNQVPYLQAGFDQLEEGVSSALNLPKKRTRKRRRR